MITAITTCMGRRGHLEMTLPLMLEEFEEVIVVDWSCPEESGKWAEKEGARVVYKKDERFFNASKARNLGAHKCESRSVCFIDADTLVMPGTCAEIERRLNLSTMVIASRDSQNCDIPSLGGFIAVDIGQFWGVKGYDESLGVYGLEDAHLRARLLFERGITPSRVPNGFLGHIRHTNELRSRYAEEPIYVTAKRGHSKLMAYLESHGVSDWVNNPITAEIAFR